MPNLPPSYNPHAVELKGYRSSLERDDFRLDVGALERWVVVAPPARAADTLAPTDAFLATLQDVLLRWERLHGNPAVGVTGVDDSEAPAPDAVLAAEGERGPGPGVRGRASFIARCHEWSNDRRRTILRQLRRLGASPDFSHAENTMGEPYAVAVREAFERLRRDDLVHRAQILVDWCPVCLTARSDDETELREVKRMRWLLRYPFADGSGGITVATERPETVFGDQAVAVHPGDERYRGAIGRRVRLPIVEREIPVIADDAVDAEATPGAFRVTPAHGHLGFQIARRHHLTVLNLLDEEGFLTAAAGPLAGLAPEKAREEVVRRFEEAGLLEGLRPHTREAAHCLKDGNPLEPVVGHQWFVRMKPLTVRAIEAVERGEVRVRPEKWRAPLLETLSTFPDWCISRQQWWGHRIPVRYCLACGEAHAMGATRCDMCGGAHLEPDQDVFDGRFASWLWPFAGYGWPTETRELAELHPARVFIVDSRRITRAARMLAAGLAFTGRAPFQRLFVAELPRAESSATHGPIAIMDRDGADALRWTLVRGAAGRRPAPLSDRQVQSSRRLIATLWNAAHVVLTAIGEGGAQTRSKVERLAGSQVDRSARDALIERSPIDRWFLARLSRLIDDLDRCREEGNYEDAAVRLESFVAADYCDWYMGMFESEPRSTPDQIQAGVATLMEALEILLLLVHPLLPFVTEEIWSQLPGERDLLSRSRLPRVVIEPNGDAEERVEVVRDIVRAVRRLRNRMNVPPTRRSALWIEAPAQTAAWLVRFRDVITRLARASEVVVGTGLRTEGLVSSVAVRGVEARLSLTGLVDPSAERARLERELTRTSARYHAIYNKLNNPGFLEQAPRVIIEEERRRLDQLGAERTRLKRNLEILAGA